MKLTEELRTARAAYERQLAAELKEHAARSVQPPTWDDDTIDDPGAQPDLGQPTGRDTRARVEDAIELFDAGEIPERIAARLGITLSTLTQNVRRHAPEWANAFKAAERRERGRSVSA